MVFTSSAWATPPRLVFAKRSVNRSHVVYTIKKGDYLYAIFRKLGFAEQEIPRAIRTTQHLNPSLDLSAPLLPGQTIRLPLPPGQTASLANNDQPSSAAPSAQRPLPTPASTTYTFRQGDTVLSVLRQKTGLTTQAIIRTYLGTFLASNRHITDLNMIHPGQRIIIPSLPQAERLPSSHATRDASPARTMPAKPSLYDQLSPREGQAWVKTMLTAMGFAFARGHETFVPHASRGWLRINTTRTPLVTTPWGELVVFMDESSTSPAPDLVHGSKISVCRVPDTWNPYLVVQALARRFPEHLATEPAPLRKHIGGQHVSVHADIMIQSRWTSSPITYGFTLLQDREHPFPSLLASLLHHGHIRLVQGRLLDHHAIQLINQPFIRPEDMYVPTITRQELLSRYHDRHGRTYPVKGLAPAAQPDLTSMDMTFHWTAGRSLVSLTCSVQRLQTEEQTIILLDQDSKYPYLVALLRLKGMACHALAPSQTMPNPATRPSP
ncbi:hypothetical protein DPF_0890 [Desulfoplanes formicivorans]|uniref:LysM domain-containing protein n=2 Tax=Desulfoplanes formicivorans TaxID=1592317 RepID=A0A194ADN3_9BACT|nr:hypothetical protein DPF_0890 [Desulfoplanes formicivorans]